MVRLLLDQQMKRFAFNRMIVFRSIYRLMYNFFFFFVNKKYFCQYDDFYYVPFFLSITFSLDCSRVTTPRSALITYGYPQ